MPTKAAPHCNVFTFECEWKAGGADGAGVVEGYGNVFDVRDNGNDIVHKGAFSKTIKERVPRRMVKFLDSHMWDAEHTHGTVVAASEDNHGLQFKAELSAAPETQALRTKMAEGHLKQTSIGYLPVVERFERLTDGVVRHLDEVKLFEISVVPFAMNEDSELTSVKAQFEALPIAGPDAPWDDAGARGRVRAWASAKGQGAISWTHYRKAFAAWDRDQPTHEAGHRYLVADVIAGELRVVPKAVLAAVRAEARAEEPCEPARAALELLLAQMAGAGQKATAPWTAAGALEKLTAAVSIGEDATQHRKTVADALRALPSAEASAIRKELDTAGPPPKAPTGDAQDRSRRLMELGAKLKLGG